MIRLFHLSALITIFFYSTCVTNEVKDSTIEKKRFLIDSLIRKSHQSGLFNGTVVVSQGNEVIYANALGYSAGDKKEMLTNNHLFSIGSIAKSFHVAAILLLVEQGKAKLDDKLSKYITNLPTWSNDITINHLLNYASGLPQLRFKDVKDESDVIKQLKELKSLPEKPGSVYLYNHNTPIIFKEIIRSATGLSFEQFVKKEVLPRAGISNSQFDPEKDNPLLAKSFDNKNVDDDPFNPFTGWLYMTSEDTHKWISSLTNGDVISKDNLHMFLKNQYFENRTTSLGQGTFDNDTLIRYESRGSYFNFRSEVQNNLLTNSIVVILENNGGRYAGRIAGAIDSIVQCKPFQIPKKSIYWAIRDSSNLDVEGVIQYYDYLLDRYPTLYNFDDPEALYFVGRRFFRNNELSEAHQLLAMNLKKHPKHQRTIELLKEVNKKYKIKE